jgi:glycosyltransferase involved in cell wall biosynthesis
MKPKDTKPLLSIAILTFNRSGYLNELLGSIELTNPEMQSKIEVIILDNGSTDNTREIINLHKDRLNINEIFSFNNIRGTESYLKLIEQASGDFVIFPGDDDVFYESGIDELLISLDKTTEGVSLIAAGAKVIDESGSLLNISYKPNRFSSQEELLSILISKSIFWFPATAIRTKILKENFLPKSLTAFDWYIWILACTKGKVDVMEMEIVKYRQHLKKEQNSYLEENWNIDATLMFSYAINKGAISDWLKSAATHQVRNFIENLAINSVNENLNIYDKLKYLMLFQEINKSNNLDSALEKLYFQFINEMDPRFKQSLLGLNTSIDDFKSLFLNVGIDFEFNSKPKQKSNFIEVISNKNGFDLIKNYLGNESTKRITKEDQLIAHLFDEYNDILRKSILNLSQIAGPVDEILIIDDGSTDETTAIVNKSMQVDNRIRYIKNINPGLVHALNLGLEESSNEWVARCDVDDIYSKDRISKQKTLIDDTVSAIFSDYKFISSDATNLGNMPSAVLNQAVSVSLSKSQRTAHPSVMYRKSAVKSAGGYKSDDFPAEDLSLWLRMSREGKLISVPDVLLMYRMSKGSISSTKRKLIQTKSKEIISKIGINYSDYTFVRENLEKIFDEYEKFTFPERRKLLLLRELLIVSAHPQHYGLQGQKRQILFQNIKYMLNREMLSEVLKLQKEKEARDRLRKINHG